ncbi:hypothetical protein DFQ26_000312 [Actinomortierella ambigua]|nr:hypothetical protein DFQ26_000312 [Actinomortierella ambigua]
MKLFSLSVAAVLLTFSATAKAALVDSPTVYFFSNANNANNHDNNNKPLRSLNGQEARMAFSHLLSLDAWDRSFGLVEDTEAIDFHGALQHVFGAMGLHRKNLLATGGSHLMMIIDGIKDTDDVMPSYNPVFTIDSKSSVHDMATELQARVPVNDRFIFNTHKASLSGDALTNEHYLAKLHADIDLTVFDLTKKADALFLEEAVSLSSYIEKYAKAQVKDETSDFVYIDIAGLAALEAEHGIDSVQYKQAVKILKEFIQKELLPDFAQVHEEWSATILLNSPSAPAAILGGVDAYERSTRHLYQKRQAPLAGSASSCFATQQDCETSTSSCSQGRGTCVLSNAANCYHCQCANVNGTQYSGASCEKIDISVQFHLFFWLIFGLVTLVGVSIALIVQMGSHSQGGVPVGPTRAQLKRD